MHFFTGRILGDPGIETPTKVHDPPNSDPKVGEAGRFWERRLLGCRIECYWDPKDALKQKQAGALYAFANGTVSKVAPSWVRQTVLSRKFHPLPSTAEASTQTMGYLSQVMGTSRTLASQKANANHTQVSTGKWP